MIFTFWEGRMPSYIKLCLNTWDKQGLEYKVLNYDNLNDYTNLSIPLLKQNSRLELYHIADIVRAHVLRDNGGYWIDTDTILLSKDLPKCNMLGVPQAKAGSIAFLHTEKQTDMYISWCKYQDRIISNRNQEITWDIVGNLFVDEYTKRHLGITIDDIEPYWLELKGVPYNIPRKDKYQRFYFENQHNLCQIEHSNMIMLHNSWTPDWYKALTEDEIMQDDHTMSNILKDVLR